MLADAQKGNVDYLLSSPLAISFLNSLFCVHAATIERHNRAMGPRPSSSDKKAHDVSDHLHSSAQAKAPAAQLHGGHETPNATAAATSAERKHGALQKKEVHISLTSPAVLSQKSVAFNAIQDVGVRLHPQSIFSKHSDTKMQQFSISSDMDAEPLEDPDRKPAREHSSALVSSAAGSSVSVPSPLVQRSSSLKRVNGVGAFAQSASQGRSVDDTLLEAPAAAHNMQSSMGASHGGSVLSARPASPTSRELLDSLLLPSQDDFTDALTARSDTAPHTQRARRSRKVALN